MTGKAKTLYQIDTGRKNTCIKLIQGKTEKRKGLYQIDTTVYLKAR